MSECYKQILGNWYWEEKKNLLVHECDQEEYSGNIRRLDSEIGCMRCKKEAPQEIVDICLLCNIKPRLVYKTIEGIWGVVKYYFNSKPYLAHWCRVKTWPYTCDATQCKWCETKIPKYIIKYCEENNVTVSYLQ